jgi:guanylate kinase
LGSEAEALLVVLSGLSGVGKDALVARMKELRRPLYYTITATTRPRRGEERDGVDYYFLSEGKFQAMVEGGEFLEWAEVYGNHYGVPRGQVKRALEAGRNVMVKVDVQGAATIKNLVPQAVLIFLAPPSLGELSERLRERGTESPSDLELRLQRAREEMNSLPMFDYVVINRRGEIDLAVSQIDAIIEAEKCRVNRRAIIL